MDYDSTKYLEEEKLIQSENYLKGKNNGQKLYMYCRCGISNLPLRKKPMGGRPLSSAEHF